MSSFTAFEHRVEGCTHILLITTGSVASIKAPLIIESLLQYSDVKIQVVSTKASLAFYDKEAVLNLLKNQDGNVWTDNDEWPANYRYERNSPILHIELRRWADVVLIAPCSANTLAKIAGGICDNLVTSLLRALAPTTPTYVFPAMNTHMFEHPLTAEHIRIIKEIIGYNVIGPIGKKLACGDVGMGAMTEWLEIVRIVVERFALQPKH